MNSVSNVDIDQVLSQMRRMASQASAQPAETEAGSGVSFGGLLKQSIDAVNETQVQASGMKQAFELGEDVDLAEVMVAAQKSSLTFQGMVQVRNKLVEAYKEVMNMPI